VSLPHAEVVAMVSKNIRRYMSRPYMSNVAGHHTTIASLLDHLKQGRIEISEQDQLLLAVSVQLDRCHLTGVATHHGRTLQDALLVVQASCLGGSMRQALKEVTALLLDTSTDSCCDSLLLSAAILNSNSCTSITHTMNALRLHCAPQLK